ncbi:MAG: 2'-5' RNA ligase [Elusimicrobia bacterium CG1_02_56_21]|nr:MAG: 2'-5' RNA ligase [Elusimicrobia bacterium CG1_02_56_21]
MRLFVASFFEPGFEDRLKDIAGYARANAGIGTVKWVEPRNFHLTYAFLGEVPQTKAAVKGMEAGLEGLKSFRISTGSFGVFPSSRHPSVLWAGIAEGAGDLRQLAGKLAEGLTGAGLVFENRFEPHVTIGRVKRRLPDNFIRRASDFSLAKKAVSSLCSVELVESVLTPEGPAYRQIYSKKLLPYEKS